MTYGELKSIDASSPLKGARLYAQLGLFLTVRTIMNSGFRMIYPFLPYIARGLGVTEAAITFGITIRAAIGLFSPLIGSVADLWGRKRAMVIGLSLFIISMVVIFFFPTYPALILSLVMTGVGKMMFDTATYAYIGDQVDYRQRGMAAGFVEFGWSGAFLLGIPLAGFLIERVGWVSPFPCFGLVAIGVLIFLWRTLPSDRKQHLHIETPRPSFLHGFRIIRNHPDALAALALAFLLAMSNEVVNVVYGSWMEHAFALKVVALGLASTVIGVAELAGEGLVAGLVDRIGKKRSLGIGIGVYAITCLVLPVLGVQLEPALVGLFLFYLAFEFSIVTSLPLMTELVPVARATMMALGAMAHSVGRMIGSLLGPVLFAYGLGANAIFAAVLTIAALGLLLLYIKEVHNPVYREP